MSCRRILTFALALATMLALGGASFARDYVITTGDVLNIKVVGEADLSKTYTVNDEGKIFMPNVREVVAYNKTALELQTEITKKLSEYYKNPVVTVEVASATALTVWVSGEVNTPGEVKVKPDSRLMDVIQKAGGLKDTANKAGAILFRKDQSQTIDLGKMMQGDMSLNVPIELGDRLHVPKEVEGKIKVLG